MLLNKRSPGGTPTTTRESSTSTKTAEAAATAAESAAAPGSTAGAPATATAADRNDQRHSSTTPAATTPSFSSRPRANNRKNDPDDEENPERTDASATRSRRSLNRNRRRCQSRIECEAEFGCESLRNTKSHELETARVIALPEHRRRFATDRARGRISDESFSALSRENKTAAAIVGVRLFRNEKNHRTGVPRWITRRSYFSNLPLSSNSERHISNVAARKIRQGYDRHLSARLAAHIFRDAIQPLHSGGIEHMREIVYQASRWRNVWLLRLDGAGSRQQTGECKRRKL